MQLPHTYIGAVLTRPTEIGRMLAAMRQRTILPAVTAHEVMLRPITSALAEIGRSIPALSERQEP